MSLTDFEIGKILGKGSFGNVCLVKRKFDGKTYAMKRIKIVQLSEKEKENSLNEIRILASLSHKNIIGYKDAFFDKKSKTLNVVMEFANDGDIYSKIKYNLKHDLFFKEEIIWDYLIQILEGLNYLHEKKIIHRDLKSANIFLMKDRTIKIGDLNVSKINKLGMAYTQTGTPYYASPEIWLDQPYDYKSDIWSLGCILYELCQLKPPFRGTSLKNLCMNIQNGVYNPIPDFYSNDLKNMISFMLQKDPNLRPSTKQILESDIIIKKIKELKINTKNNKGEERQGLIATIKVPRNLGEINKSLPKSKYNNKIVREEMLMEDEYETNKRKNGFLDEKDKKEIKNVCKNQNKNKANMNSNNIIHDNNNINNYNYNNSINYNNIKSEQNNDINYMNYNNNNNNKTNNNYDMNNNYMNYNHNVNNLVNNIKDSKNNYSFGERQVQNVSDEYGNVINNNVIFQNKDSYQNYQNNYYLNQQYLNSMNSNQIPIINNNFIDNSQNNFNINFNNNYNNTSGNQQLMNKENYNANANSNNYNNNFSFGENALNNQIHCSQNKEINNQFANNKKLNNSKGKNKNSYSKDQIHNRNSINSNSNTPHYLNKRNIINKPRLSQGKGNHNHLINHIDNLDKKRPSLVKNNYNNKKNIIIKNNNYNKINNNNVSHNNKYINSNEEQENHYHVINNKKINNNYQVNERKKRATSSKNPRINVISKTKNHSKNNNNNISHNLNYNNNINKNNLKLNKNSNNRSEVENKSKNFNMPNSYNKQKFPNKVNSGKEGIKNNSKNRQNKVHTPTPNLMHNIKNDNINNNKMHYPIMKKRNNKNVKIEKYIYPSKRKQNINNSYNVRQNYIQQQPTKNRINKINNNINTNHNLKKRITHNSIETNKNNNSGVYNYRNYVKKDSSHLY